MNRSNSGICKGSTSSGKLQMLGSERKSVHISGRAPVKKVTLSRQGVDEYRRQGEEALRARLNNMQPEDQQGLDCLQSLAEDDDFHAGDLPPYGGGEFSSLEQDLETDSGDDDDEKKARKVDDWRTRRDRTEIRNRDFLSQIAPMVTAYIRFCGVTEVPVRARNEGLEETAEEIYEIQVMDMFDTRRVDVKLDPRGNGVAPALIMEGLMPCAPTSPTVAIKIRVLETYHVTHVRCPHLAIQAFVKSLCDIHRVPYRPYLCQQSSIAYDLYLDSRRRTEERMMNSLGRDSTWRLKHACPACTYKLEGEDALIFEMLTTMDGNDSLKRVLRREKATSKMGEPVLGKSRERVDNRDAGDGYYISRERVERWVRDRVADKLPMQPEEMDKDNPCVDRWKNMINDVTSRMWGIFDETGIFLALLVKELLDAFGLKLGASYNVGCHFEATVTNSGLGNEVREKKLKCLVGSFHGHAHNRLCQLQFLATYVEGMGLEDLEGCEHFFSCSNGLAKSCCYASRFHRQQEITTYAKHFDSFETYANLSKFLCSNALAILKTEAPLRTWMRQEGVDSVDRFGEWLAEETTYLKGLKSAPKTNNESLEMEYVQRLVNLSASQAQQMGLE
ncbi:hypothetical protein K438DRAFT_1981881 [Mycena galopus ATCC 62051]|nr:hypothetical protein K438DRAFT_1981881 [Mycena galopus ATCC 62051]